MTAVGGESTRSIAVASWQLRLEILHFRSPPKKSHTVFEGGPTFSHPAPGGRISPYQPSAVALAGRVCHTCL